MKYVPHFVTGLAAGLCLWLLLTVIIPAITGLLLIFGCIALGLYLKRDKEEKVSGSYQKKKSS